MWRIHYELVIRRWIHFQSISVDEENGVCGCEGSAPVAVVVFGQRFHERGGFFCGGRVVPHPWDGRRQIPRAPYLGFLGRRHLIDLPLMDGQNFGDS